MLATAEGTPIGYAGELHPKLVAASDLPARTVAMELNLDSLLGAELDVVQARPISGYPAATQDVALVVDDSVPAAELRNALEAGAGELLEDVRVFDVYRGPGIEDGRKSVALALRFRAPDRTLTAAEASAAREAAVAVAAERHGAVLRG